MKAVFMPKTPVSQIDENIVLNSRVVGWVRQNVASTNLPEFHCGLNVDVNDMFPALIQGYGGTKEEAIYNALQKGSTYADALANGIAVLIAELGGLS